MGAILIVVTHTTWPASTLGGRYLRERFPCVTNLKYGPPNRGPWADIPGFPGASVSLTPSPIPLPKERELLVLDSPGKPRSATVGGAFGLRLGAYYASPLWFPKGPTDGRRRAMEFLGHEPGKDLVWRQLQREFAVLCTTLRGQPPDPNSTTDQRLTRLCIVMTWYQQVSVTHGLVLPRSIVNGIPPDMTVDYLAETLVHQRMVDVVTRLMVMAADRLPEPVICERVVIEPPCGDGQADLLLDGLLLEVKSGRKPPSITKDHGYQLLGYLLGLDPSLEVTRAGWFFARYGILWDVPVDDFLEVAAGEPVALDVARSEWDNL